VVITVDVAMESVNEMVGTCSWHWNMTMAFRVLIKKPCMMDVPLGPRLNWENDTEMYIREICYKVVV